LSKTRYVYQSAFMRRKNPDTGKRDWKGAIGDAVIVFFITLLSNLAMYGYPPTPEIVYSAFITAFLMFFVSIQRSLKIEIPEGR